MSSDHSIAMLCDNLEVSPSGFYDWDRRRRTYGSPRITDADTAMRMHFQDTTLALSGITELKGANSAMLRDEARAALRTGLTTIDVDLSETRFVDSSGLGALIALHKTMCARGGKLRIIDPTPSVQQILELTRLHRVFEIVKTT
jgi:anti-sigma B factor antagonist